MIFIISPGGESCHGRCGDGPAARDSGIDRDRRKDMTLNYLDKVRRSMKTGRPAGPSDFLKVIEELTGRTLEPKKPGPKKKK